LKSFSHKEQMTGSVIRLRLLSVVTEDVCASTR